VTEDAALEEILKLVHARTHLDFSLYRHATIRRRVRNRMLGLGMASLADYLPRLRASDAETAALVDRLAIKVSRFYRNAPAFDLLRRCVLPGLAASTGRRPLRVWSVGCGYGEEPHSLAMLLEEAALPGWVLATDIDPQALVQAREGIYTEPALRELPEPMRGRFLEDVPGRARHWRVRDEVRRRITWRVDDIVTGVADREGFDLVCCRNLVIYLERPTQEIALAKMARSLRPGGFLLLGEAEWPCASVLGRLDIVSSRWRLFRNAIAERIAA
jgi:chemotaxis methyl-accepting protein methylase